MFEFFDHRPAARRQRGTQIRPKCACRFDDVGAGLLWCRCVVLGWPPLVDGKRNSALPQPGAVEVVMVIFREPLAELGIMPYIGHIPLAGESSFVLPGAGIDLVEMLQSREEAVLLRIGLVLIP